MGYGLGDDVCCAPLGGVLIRFEWQGEIREVKGKEGPCPTSMRGWRRTLSLEAAYADLSHLTKEPSVF